jgi:hypothetical protein
MKNLIFLILFFGVSIASGCPDLPTLYIEMSRPVIKAPERADIQFERFTKHLGLIESSNNWKVINSLGCMGLFQFTAGTLESLGYHGITPERFKADPGIFPIGMQKQALKDLIKHNEHSLRKFTQFIGQTINGVVITKAGLIGASHLAGAGGVIKYLTSNHNATDCNGASVQKYLKEFQTFTI